MFAKRLYSLNIEQSHASGTLGYQSNSWKLLASSWHIEQECAKGTLCYQLKSWKLLAVF